MINYQSELPEICLIIIATAQISIRNYALSVINDSDT